MKFILVSHGNLSRGLLDTVRMLLGPQRDICAHVLRPEEEASHLGERLLQELGAEDEGNVIFFTDLYFGSPFNQVVELARTHDIYHITGMNAPALIEAIAARDRGKDSKEVVRAAIGAAEGSIMDVRALLEQGLADSEAEEWQ